MQRFIKYVFTSLHMGRMTLFCLFELAVGQALLIFETVSSGTILNSHMDQQLTHHSLDGKP